MSYAYLKKALEFIQHESSTCKTKHTRNDTKLITGAINKQEGGEGMAPEF